jgi:hypothetical protein
VPCFWKKFKLQSRLSLGHLNIKPADAEWIIADMLRRFGHIRPELPLSEHSPVYRHFAMLVGDAITAEQYLFAAHKGRVPGEMVDDWSLPGVPKVDHPSINEEGGERAAKRVEGAAPKLKGRPERRPWLFDACLSGFHP